MDKIEEIISNAQLACGVFGNPSTGEYRLLDFPLQENSEFTQHGLDFLGVVALVDGLPKTGLLIPLDPFVTASLASEFVRRVENGLFKIFESQVGGVDWLDSLYSLPDPRPDPR